MSANDPKRTLANPQSICGGIYFVVDIYLLQFEL